MASTFHWLFFLLKLAFVCLPVGAGAYWGLRWFEKRGAYRAVWLNFLGSFGILMAVGLYDPVLGLFAFGVPGVVGLGGAFFHRKSGGTSANFAAAFFLMMFAALLTGVALWFLLQRLPFRWVATPAALRFLDHAYFWLFFVVAPVFLMPFLLWAYQRLRLLPGVDRNFEDEEMAP